MDLNFDDQGLEKIDIDCSRCTAKPAACSDCMVSVLLDSAPVDASPADRHLQLDAEEHAALQVLAEQGLVPPLRLVRGVTPLQPENFPRQQGASG